MTADRQTGGPADRDRREFLGVIFGAMLLSAGPTVRRSAQGPDSLPGSGSSGKLWDPGRAGRPLEPVTAADNAAAIQTIEKRLRCTCGCNLDVYTCRTTDFTCTTSPEMHRRVLTLANQGKSAQEIIDDFVRQDGVAILMAPPKRGFNLAGYFAPSIVILFAALLLTLALWRWSRRGREQPMAAPAAPPDATPEELARLRRELEQLPE